MKRKKYLLTALLLCVLSGYRVKAQSELPFAEELQNVLESSHRSTNVMGVSVAVVVPGYSTWLGVCGESYPGQPVTPDMLFDMASVSKLITSALVLDLCEDGLIALDDPVSKYLPSYPNVDGSITIRQCLNHTNGLYDMVPHPGGPFRVPYNSIDFEKWWTIEEIFTVLGGEPYFAPGEGFHYTQAGYQLVSLIIEKVTNSTIAAEMQKRLLDPLALNGMLFDFSKPVPDRYDIAHPWVDTDSDGVPEDVFSKSRNWIASLSRILFYTRAKDLAVFTHALFTRKLLSAKSTEEMLKLVHLKPEDVDKPLFTDYGLGVMKINPQLMQGHESYGHLGSIPGYRAFVSHLTDCSITIAFLYNSDTDEGGIPVLNGLLEIVFRHIRKQ